MSWGGQSCSTPAAAIWSAHRSIRGGAVNHAGLGVRFSDVQWDVQWDMQLDVQLDVQWIDEDPCPDAKAGQANDSTAISADARPVPRARHCPTVELPRMVGNFDGTAAILGISMMSAGQQVSRSAGQQVSRSASQQASRPAGQQVSRPADRPAGRSIPIMGCIRHRYLGRDIGQLGARGKG
jgi:hypothetical protein